MFKDLTGERFGNLEVLDFAGTNADGHRQWRCRCECGSITLKRGHHLRSGASKSCGYQCPLRSEAISAAKIKHGHACRDKNGRPAGTRAYRIWGSMKNRCQFPSQGSYQYYGARGIKVCERWQNSFEAFLEDMGEPPEGMSIDRIDVNGNYEPGNCRWATASEQQLNKR